MAGGGVAGGIENKVDDAAGDVDASGLDAVAELHRVVDLADEQPVARRLEEVDREDATADGAGGAEAEIADFGRDREDRGLAAAGGVGDPVRAVADDAADGLVADDEDAEVALGLVDVLLHVEDRVLDGAERGLVLHDRLGGVAVVDAGEEAAPGTGGGLEHGGVAVLLDGGEGRLGLERDAGAGSRDAVPGEQHRSRELVSARLDYRGRVDARDAVALEDADGSESLRLADAAVEHGVEAGPRAGVVDVEDHGAHVDEFVRDVAGGELVGQQALFDADA